MFEQREQLIKLWFSMWLKSTDLGIDTVFTPDCIYVESWGPKYCGIPAIKHWFDEWNTRGKVITWEIKQFFHSADQTIVEWYFKNHMDDGRIENFDGVSLVKWSDSGKINFIKEFGCKLPNYNPYEHGDTPELKNAEMWI